MRIIISGGSGLIGRALTGEFDRQGHEVMVLSRSPGRVSGLPGGAQALAWDGRSASGWGASADGSDVIINLAGASLAGENLTGIRWTNKRKQTILDSRVNAGKAVMEAITAARSKPRLLLQASAVGYYGPLDEQPVSEEQPKGDGFLADVCQAWEDSTTAVEALGVRRIVMRLGVVLAPGNPVLDYLALPFRMFVGGPLGDGEQYFPWLHIDDVLGAVHLFIQDESCRGVYNLTAPGAVDNKTLAKTLGLVLKRPSWLPLPAFAMKLALGEVSSMMLDGQNVVPERLGVAGYNFVQPEIEGALRAALGCRS